MNTMQQEFDAVVAHLYTQGAPARDEVNGDCLYRTESGLMCAVGCRIPDAVYDDDMENRDMDMLMEVFAGDLPKEFSAYQPMYSSLQGVHDGWRSYSDDTFTEHLTKTLPEVAAEFGLTFTVPKQGA